MWKTLGICQQRCQMFIATDFACPFCDMPAFQQSLSSAGCHGLQIICWIWTRDDALSILCQKHGCVGRVLFFFRIQRSQSGQFFSEKGDVGWCIFSWDASLVACIPRLKLFLFFFDRNKETFSPVCQILAFPVPGCMFSRKIFDMFGFSPTLLSVYFFLPIFPSMSSTGKPKDAALHGFKNDDGAFCSPFSGLYGERCGTFSVVCVQGISFIWTSQHTPAECGVTLFFSWMQPSAGFMSVGSAYLGDKPKPFRGDSWGGL